MVVGPDYDGRTDAVGEARAAACGGGGAIWGRCGIDGAPPWGGGWGAVRSGRSWCGKTEGACLVVGEGV